MIDQLVWSRKSKAATLAPISHSVFPFECLQFFHFSWIDVFLFRFFGFPTVWFRFLWWSGWIFNAPRSTITIDRMIGTFFDNFWWNYLLIISGGINISIQWNCIAIDRVMLEIKWRKLKSICRANIWMMCKHLVIGKYHSASILTWKLIIPWGWLMMVILTPLLLQGKKNKINNNIVGAILEPVVLSLQVASRPRRLLFLAPSLILFFSRQSFLNSKFLWFHWFGRFLYDITQPNSTWTRTQNLIQIWPRTWTWTQTWTRTETWTWNLTQTRNWTRT